ncbi:MAG: hypothetical protein R3F60_14550 [bacterium]
MILDPPSTSTGPRKKRWSAARDYPELVALALPLLRPGGALWTVTNHRATPPHRFARKIADALPEGSTLERVCPPPSTSRWTAPSRSRHCGGASRGDGAEEIVAAAGPCKAPAPDPGVPMRALALLAALLALPALAHARCASGGLGLWPTPGATLPPQGYLLLEGFGSERERVARLADGQAWLVNRRGQAVALKVAAVHSGFLNVSQAALLPAEPLTKGTWRLELGPAGKHRPPTFYLPDGRGPASYEVSGVADEAVIRWTGAPTAEPGDWAELGCGPAIQTPVKVPVEGAALAIVTLVRTEGGGRWWFPVEDGAIRLGHGMCTGPYDVRGPEMQTARIRPLPAAGGPPLEEKVVRFPGLTAPAP